ncbi:receptor protein kinase-like protein [Thioploca ingrica]|uniref:Receptor protein kinase-like protein n=1 Tax=Thioploca ingrica TaxID=40754 RepID=A0A090ABE1_9GAMM|nr:receptor protein kinase-like protein [Thioploca ingrica]
MFINVAAFAALEVTPNSYDFGKVLVGSSSAGQAFNLLNTNPNSLPIGTIETLTTVIDEEFGNVTTVRSQEFIINNDLCSNTTIANAENCQVTVVFKPKSAGARTATLSIPTLDPNMPTVNITLSGYGTEEPNIEASLTSYDFGELEVGKTSPSQIIMIRNTGRKSLEIGTINLSGDKDNFVFQDYCSNIKIIPSAYSYCTLRVAFKPLLDGLKKAIISIPSNDPDTPTLEIALSGGSDVVKVPNIEVTPLTESFGEVQVGSASTYKTITISNTGTAYLQLGTVSLFGEDFNSLGDFCSNQKIRPGGSCYVNIRFEPKSIGEKTGMLSIASDDSDMPTVAVSLKGTGSNSCSNYQFSTPPSSPNFGTEIVDKLRSLKQNLNIQATGCVNAVKIEAEAIEVNGTDKAEFSISDKECYPGSYGNTFYSNCQFVVTFKPKSVGAKTADLTFNFTDGNSSSIPLQANAVAPPGQPNIKVTPTSHNFGSVVIGRSSSSPRFTVTNKGSSNLKLEPISITGTGKSSFSKNYDSCSSREFLPPLEQCYMDIKFMPITAGEQQANLTIDSNDPDTPTLNIPLTGIAQAPGDCSDANITIESSGDPSDHRWAAKTQDTSSISRSGVHYFHTYSGVYDGTTLAWKRLKNFQEGESATPNKPRENDVVRIKNGHAITGIPYARVRALCIDQGGRLESLDDQGTSVEIYASNYIENKGIVKGQNGAEGKAGAGIYLMSGNWTYPTSPFYNEGEIKGGNGGAGIQYGGNGGPVNVHGDGITNTLHSDGTGGIVIAGKGGDITGIQTGKGGDGGRMTVLGVSYIQHFGDVKITAGDGGHCNPLAAAPQTGGTGGDVGWNAQTYVNVAGTFSAGKGGRNCSTNGRDGSVYMDPSLISLVGGHTKIEGNNITIFGGKEWTLDLRNLNDTNGPVLSATGDITLAVGKDGIIDFRGSRGHILKANGHVYIFADTILLDTGMKLSDLIESSAGIVVGPNKILYEVSLSVADQLFGKPQEVLPISLTLSNDGPETDTYQLSVTDTAGWVMSQLPSSLQLRGIDAVDLVLNVTLADSLGAKNIITVTAISQSDPTVIITKEIQISVSATGNDSSTGVTPPPQPLSTCASSSGIIDWVCRNNRDQVLTNVIIETKGNVAGGILAGEVTNKGIISQVKVQSGAVVNGGKLTGYINNEGTLSNFEFVGAEISGGTLAGTVNNNSQVGGTFKDVHLAADTHLRGGYLQGNIKGDKDAPALLENVTIKSDSLLSGVKLGEGVMLEAKVTCGEGVQAQEGICPSEIELPPLRATATNAQGEPMMTAAIFSGGISVNQGAFESPATLTITDLVDILGQIQVDPLDLGQAAEAVVYVSYKPLAAKFSEPPVHFMLNEKGDILPWDEDIRNLVAFQAVAQLVPYLEVPMYQGPLPATGHLKISFGYRLTEGTVVHNLEPIEVTITE